MLILSLDTSTTVCSVALHTDGRLLACYELLAERSSSGMLTTLLRDVVRHTGHELAQIDAIAVGKGPGSYTGLRIGVSTAKGLCFALDKPLIGINTLQAMAKQVVSRQSSVASQLGSGTPQSLNPSILQSLFCPLIDARRMEVYTALYDADAREVRPTAAVIVDETTLADVLAERPVVFFGSGAAKCRPVLGAHPNAIFLDSDIYPSARTVGELATEAYAEARFEDVAAFEPFYLKDFVGTKPRKALV